MVISALRHLVAGIDSSNSCPRGSICGRFTTAPPKPFVQTTLLLEAMASSEQREDEKWDNLTASIDLLFAKVGAMDRTQQQISAQLDLSAQVMERMIQDQQTLAKQVDATGQAVARLTLNRQQMHPPSPRPIHREDQSWGFEQGEFSRAHEDRSPRPPPVSHRVSTDSHSFSRHCRIPRPRRSPAT